MIAFLKGRLYSVIGDTVVIDVNGVGYQIQVPLSILPGLPSPGSEVLLHTFMAVREDAVSLYGFDRLEALEVFRLLLNVSGVGPKGALSLLSVMTPQGLSAAVAEENAVLLSRAPGIGKKIAQRVILELKDKLRPVDFLADAGPEPVGRGDGTTDAIEALVSLGFPASRAALAAGRAAREMGSGTPTPQLVRQALKYLAEYTTGME